MLREVITYTDYNGVERTEPFYFNLTETELNILNLSIKGGLEQMLQNIIAAQDFEAIVKLLKKIVHMSYGEKSDDGKRFIKSDALAEAFEQTPAYDKFFMELLTDDKKASDFINAIVPNKLQSKSVEITEAASK